jgi:hypothetical protein
MARIESINCNGIGIIKIKNLHLIEVELCKADEFLGLFLSLEVLEMRKCNIYILNQAAF